MSYYEALADNIRISKKNGFTIYYPPCHICGASVESWNYVSGLQYTCTACREMLIDSHNQTSNKQQDCLNRAIKRISKISQNIDTEFSGFRTISEKAVGFKVQKR